MFDADDLVLRPDIGVSGLFSWEPSETARRGNLGWGQGFDSEVARLLIQKCQRLLHLLRMVRNDRI
jgi:hypothetical protein